MTREEFIEKWCEDRNIRSKSEFSLPPAEGAEAQRCPVCMGKGLVPNSFYATTSGIGSTTQTYLPEKCRTCNGAGVILPSYLQKQQQPTAEGAEEILAKYEIGYDEQYHRMVYERDALKAMQDFATLHAQRIADKMVSERLREELIAYDKWLGGEKWGISELLSPEATVSEYLKTREK